MKKVVLVTAHYHAAKRRAGFHWLANAYHKLGWDVLLFTAPISWISVLRKDYRVYDHPIFREINKIEKIAERFSSFIWFTPLHPTNLRLPVLNTLSKNVFLLYRNFSLGKSEAWIKTADLVIFESTAAIILLDRFKELNPSARYVYRVSDDLNSMGVHPLILEYEKESAPKFDLVSMPSEYILENFEHSGNAKLHFHGIETERFDADSPNPYSEYNGKVNIVFVGNSFFDYDFLERASRLFPEWLFHIIGPIPNLLTRENIITYGEMRFDDTIPYIKHADIGLQIREHYVGAEALTHSLKTRQYTYCRLPVVLPSFMQTDMPNYFYYTPGSDESILQALLDARAYDRNLIDPKMITSWTDLANILAGD